MIGYDYKLRQIFHQLRVAHRLMSHFASIAWSNVVLKTSRGDFIGQGWWLWGGGGPPDNVSLDCQPWRYLPR